MPVVSGVETALDAPEGYVVDFDRPERRGTVEIYAVAAVGLLLVLVGAGQRAYVRAIITRRLELDDVLFALAVAAAVVTIASWLYVFADGLAGVHAWEIPLASYNSFLLIIFVSTPTFLLTTSLSKFSLLHTFLSLAPRPSHFVFRFCIIATTILILGYTIFGIVGSILACNPIAASWDAGVATSGEGARCINRQVLHVSVAVADVLSGIAVLALPAQSLARMSLQGWQRGGVVAMFALGSLAVVVAVVRLCVLPGVLDSEDQSWAVSHSAFWIIAESSLVTFCASFPTLSALFDRLLSRSTLLPISDKAFLTTRSHPSMKRQKSMKRHPSSKNRHCAKSDTQAVETQVADLDPVRKGLVASSAGAERVGDGYPDNRGKLRKLRGGEEDEGRPNLIARDGVEMEKEILKTTTITVVRSDANSGGSG